MAPSAHSGDLVSPVALCAEQHRNFGYLKKPGTASRMPELFAPITFQEFADIARFYPILFFNNETTFPVSISGRVGKGDRKFSPGTDIYRPAVYQLYPFILEKLPGQDAGILLFDPKGQQVVPINENKEAAPLFTKSGEPSDLLRQIADFAGKIHEGRQIAVAFAEALRSKGVLTPSRFEYSEPGEQGQKVNRLYMINEQAFRALPSSTVYEWFQNGFLEAAQLVMLSQRHWLNYQ
ncbi:SapC family protein [Agrobacterium sp. S2]|nr:SapC family protein [Agrobacterium sp. S2]